MTGSESPKQKLLRGEVGTCQKWSKTVNSGELVRRSWSATDYWFMWDVKADPGGLSQQRSCWSSNTKEVSAGSDGKVSESTVYHNLWLMEPRSCRAVKADPCHVTVPTMCTWTSEPHHRAWSDESQFPLHHLHGTS